MLNQDDNKVCYKNNLQEARPKRMSKLSSLTSHDLALWNTQILINEVQCVIFFSKFDILMQEIKALRNLKESLQDTNKI